MAPDTLFLSTSLSSLIAYWHTCFTMKSPNWFIGFAGNTIYTQFKVKCMAISTLILISNIYPQHQYRYKNNAFMKTYLLTSEREVKLISPIPTSLIFAHFINKQKHDFLSCTFWDYDKQLWSFHTDKAFYPKILRWDDSILDSQVFW